MSVKKAENTPPGEPVKPPAHPPAPPVPRAPGDDLDFGVIVRAGIGLAVASAVVAALLAGFMRVLEGQAEKRDRVPALESTWPTFADQGQKLRKPDGGVLLQRQPFADLEAMREEEKKWLTEPTRFIDKGAGVVHIPIEDAMKLLVRRGLPVRGASAPAAPSPAEAGTR
jgi:hypothetical protein